MAFDKTYRRTHRI